MAVIQCVRCGKEGTPIGFVPFRGELGDRIKAGICQTCWAEWLQHQTMLINHYGLNLRDPEAKDFLTDQSEKFLFGGESEEVDTTKKGTINW